MNTVLEPAHRAGFISLWVAPQLPPLICDVWTSDKEGGLTGGPRALVSPGHHPARRLWLRMSTFCLVVSEACHLPDLGILRTDLGTRPTARYPGR